MCLYTNLAKAEKTTKEITCYKVLCRDSNNEIITPHRREEVSLGLMQYGYPLNKVYADYSTKIGEGFVHAFRYEDSAINCCKQMQSDEAYNSIKYTFPMCFNLNDTFFVVKCVIPKDTEYYIGSGIVSYDEICARKMEITTEITYISKIKQ